MIKLNSAVNAWGAPGFDVAFKQEVSGLPVEQLQLQRCLNTSSYATGLVHEVMILNVRETGQYIEVKAGVFFAGVIAGCNCADDPSPVDEQNEYCELLFSIDRNSAITTVELVSS